MTRSAPEIEWAPEDPPRAARPTEGSDRKAQAAAMRAHPGKWLIWTRAAKTRTVVFRLRAEGFEATSVANGDGTVMVYARAPEVTSGNQW